MNDLEKTIVAHYHEKHLTDTALNRIIAMGEATQDQQTGHSPADTAMTKKRARGFFNGWPMANWQVSTALFSTAIILGITFGIVFGQNQQSHISVTQLVLEEIAMNHNKRLSVEYPIAEYGSLRTAMSRLDFGLERPKLLADNYRLLGGRYCSIQGKIAAQLKVKDTNSGEIATLYITPMTERLATVSEQQVLQDDVNIILWKADKFFYGLATTPK
ncbi:MAG: hypothetical protein ACC707_06730 [Thiohalomonadales bacterium]